MTVTEALRIINKAPSDAPPYRISLVCGFTTLHLQMFLAAHVQTLLPDRKVEVSGGLFGDFAGTLEYSEKEPFDTIAIALEWADLDPRLGFRGAGLWTLEAVQSIPLNVRSMLTRIARALERLQTGARIALQLPTLPLPPLFHAPTWIASSVEVAIYRELYEFAANVAASGRTTLTNSAILSAESPYAGRYDLKTDLLTGMPYTVGHADHAASLLARTLLPPPPKKAIITDLDDTLWSGIVGEVGPEGVHWDLANHSQVHGLYQNLLASLSEQGTLIAVASKNDPAVVEKAFEREDLLLRPGRVFPIEAHWDAKSNSIGRILETWNISSDSVVFVDDSPMELAEVAAQHPKIECLLFPRNDYPACLKLFQRIRDLCGKERVSEDDRIRLDSIRRNAGFREATAGQSAPETFLENLNAVVSFDFEAAGKSRALELVNKTNQFNLNGVRYTEPEWKRRLERPGTVLGAVGYEDKFGPLGTIAVILGYQQDDVLNIDTWVMSCRAFSRRIEHQCLKVLLERTRAEEIRMDFVPTVKNGPLQDFLSSIGGRLERPVRIGRPQFESQCPPLYHEVRYIGKNQNNG